MECVFTYSNAILVVDVDKYYFVAIMAWEKIIIERIRRQDFLLSNFGFKIMANKIVSFL
jgi:hypothetical protein